MDSDWGTASESALALVKALGWVMVLVWVSE